MRFFALLSVCLLVALLFVGLAQAEETPACKSFCTFDYTPVCGEFQGRTQTYPNACAMDVHKCQSKEDWKLKTQGEC